MTTKRKQRCKMTTKRQIDNKVAQKNFKEM